MHSMLLRYTSLEMQPDSSWRIDLTNTMIVDVLKLKYKSF